MSKDAIGIDLGSDNSLIAVLKAGGVDILTNDLSNRSTPTIVGFGDRQRCIGEAGLSSFGTNYRNTVSMVPRLLAGPSPSDMKWLTCKTVCSEGRLQFEVRYRGETRYLSGEQLLGMYFSHLKRLCANSGLAPSRVVVSVPSYYTESERRAVLAAADIAELPCAKVMNDTTAAALSYGLFRWRELGDQPRHVAIVDLGHSKLSVAIGAFTKEKVQILARECDRNLGGRDFDWVLMQHFAQEFESKYKLNPLENTRSKIKLAKACEKLRKVLSANTDAQISIENLMEDYDLSSVLTREAMEMMCAPLLDRIQSVCMQALRDSGLTHLDSVEIIGGATRIPSVQSRLQQAFQVPQVSKTMNAEEAIARGCAVQAAMLSTSYRVREYGISDVSIHPINAALQYVDNPDGQVTTEELFAAGSTFPVSKTITTRRNRPFRVEVYYPEEVVRERTIARYTVNCPTLGEDQKLKVTIRMNANGTVDLDSVDKIGVVEENPINERATTSKNITNNPRKRVSKSQVSCEKWRVGMSDSEISAAAEGERRMCAADNFAEEALEKKNELETLVYTWRDRLRSSYRDYVSASARAEILEGLEGTEEWLYGDGRDVTKLEYEHRIRSLKDSIFTRFSVHPQLPGLVQALRQTLAKCEELAKPQSEKDREKILKECTATQVWLEHALQTVESTLRREISLCPEDVQKRQVQLQQLLSSVLNKSRPTRPKTAGFHRPLIEDSLAPPEPMDVDFF